MLKVPIMPMALEMPMMPMVLMTSMVSSVRMFSNKCIQDSSNDIHNISIIKFIVNKHDADLIFTLSFAAERP